MSTGALIFAFNNDDIDYLSMANWSAANIRRHLGIGTTVVTDNTRVPDNFNFEQVIVVDKELGGQRHFSDIGHTVPWYNANRVDAYRLTPYDQTLVLDADYIVASSKLKVLFNSNLDFVCHRTAWDITGPGYFDESNWFGNYKLPMWWATVMLFRKSNTAQYIFDSMQMIKNNWQHYRNLYGIQRSTYRNDYALSIALGIVNGHTLAVDSIPWDLATIMPDHAITQLAQDSFDIHWVDVKGARRNIGFFGTDLHVMGKKHLGKIIEAH